MNSQPLVSVIVPSYCHEDFILECIDSIHRQSYARIELVLIDDVSSDQTFVMAQALLASQYAKRFENVVVKRNAVNLGAHATINAGIKASKGSYVAVINSDDRYHPDRIEKMINAMQDAGSELAFSLVSVVSDNPPETKLPSGFALFELEQLMEANSAPSIGFALQRRNIATSTGNLVFSRALYDRVGTFLPLKYCHDWDFALQACYFTEPVFVAERLYDYRLHGTNSFSSLSGVAGMESEVVLRRFFRRGLMGSSPNPLFPCEENWPGYFSLYVRSLGQMEFLNREADIGGKSWRIYEKGVGS